MKLENIEMTVQVFPGGVKRRAFIYNSENFNRFYTVHKVNSYEIMEDLFILTVDDGDNEEESAMYQFHSFSAAIQEIEAMENRKEK